MKYTEKNTADATHAHFDDVDAFLFYRLDGDNVEILVINGRWIDSCMTKRDIQGPIFDFIVLSR